MKTKLKRNTERPTYSVFPPLPWASYRFDYDSESMVYDDVGLTDLQITRSSREFPRRIAGRNGREFAMQFRRLPQDADGRVYGGLSAAVQPVSRGVSLGLGSVTFGCWIRRDILSTSPYVGVLTRIFSLRAGLFSEQNTIAPNIAPFTVWFSSNNGILFSRSQRLTSPVAFSSTLATFTYSLPLDTWVHMVVRKTVTGTTVSAFELFINGAFVESPTLSGDAVNWENTISPVSAMLLTMGAVVNTGSFYTGVDASVDLVKIYDRAIDNATIAEWYQRELDN